MYKLKSIARRGTALVAALALFVGTGSVLLPLASYADSLNPLTERSLTLSSSSPGWANTDGSGNSTYAPPNSGANGQKSGNYFSFRVSTDTTSGGTNTPITAMSFQYCTESAGKCASPGDDLAGSDDSSHSDLNVNYSGATEIGSADNPVTGTVTLTSGSAAVTGTGTSFVSDLKVGGTFKTAGGNIYVIKSITDNTHLTLTSNASASESSVAITQSDFEQVINATDGSVKAVPGYTNENPKYQSTGGTGDPAEAAKNVSGNYVVMYNNAGTWTQSTGWTIATSNQEEATSGTTGKQNTIILQNSGGLALPATTQVKVLFFATSSHYITNPGHGYFFVKINTFKHFSALSSSAPINTLANNVASGDVIDGGVTVANVMNQSIQITTKVLETMEFSVGTVDPDTLSNAQLYASTPPGGTGTQSHIVCDTIRTAMNAGDPQNVLQLGDQNSESSLKTNETYATHSYWRLSSNSSAGATVYYSGHTLSNTSGDEITPINNGNSTPSVSKQGSEQFGLAIDQVPLTGGHGFDDASYGVDYTTPGTTTENGADNDAAGLVAAGHNIDTSQLVDAGATNAGSGDYTGINASFHSPRLDPLVPKAAYANGSGTITNNGSAQFAFDKMSDTVPTPIATENSQVVDCVTAKMRYIANIAATTPAGIYTTKINYIAAPQY